MVHTRFSYFFLLFFSVYMSVFGRCAGLSDVAIFKEVFLLIFSNEVREFAGNSF